VEVRADHPADLACRPSPGVIVMWSVATAGFVVAHGLVHNSFLKAPLVEPGGPPWPFALEASWLLRSLHVPEHVQRGIGRAVTVAVVSASFVAGAALLLGASWWAPALLLAAGLSAAQLLVWFHPWLLLGLVIDAGLAAIALGWWTAPGLPAT
jgi:hypothetical protein